MASLKALQAERERMSELGQGCTAMVEIGQERLATVSKTLPTCPELEP